MKPDADTYEFIIIVFIILAVAYLIGPFGHTISSEHILKARSSCEDHGGVDRYDTFFTNEAVCEDGHTITISDSVFRQVE